MSSSTLRHVHIISLAPRVQVYLASTQQLIQLKIIMHHAQTTTRTTDIDVRQESNWDIRKTLRQTNRAIVACTIRRPERAGTKFPGPQKTATDPGLSVSQILTRTLWNKIQSYCFRSHLLCCACLTYTAVSSDMSFCRFFLLSDAFPSW